MQAPSRITLIGAGFGLVALAITGRAAQLQLVQGAEWRERARAQQTTRVALPARRGTLFDRNGVVLAVSRETFTVGVAPSDLDDAALAAARLAAALGLPRHEVSAALRSGRLWVEWPGPFAWGAVEPLRAVRGVHLLRRLERFYPRAELAPRLIGRSDAAGRGSSGLERSFDSLLAGRSGSAVMLRDHRGNTWPSPSRPATEPVDGADIVLTLDAELQEIADRALQEAVRGAQASGGDVVILQPFTGEVLAMSSARSGPASGSLVGEIFEPGSTAKVFTAAALLRSGKAVPSDTVYAERGVWVRGGRRIEDTHRAATVSLRDVIRLSSNIGIVKLGARLSAVEQFQALRDFGFGTATGIELPGESPGRLRHPRAWSLESQASLAMGYELAVTPLQLAAAYAVFANGGLLLEPTLVREVRDGGELRWRRGIRPVRRVVEPEVAAELATMLRGVVEGGTGQAAALGTYQVAGKTGTARRVVEGRYLPGHYTASFVGYFPAQDPQFVVVVKIDDPAGTIFGGATAAPVVRTILEAILATPAVAVDRPRLASRVAPPLTPPARAADTAVTVAWPPGPASEQPGEAMPVPDVAGLDVRAAARILHGSGFRVRVEGRGRVARTSPAAGLGAVPGALVTVHAGRLDAR